MHDPNHYRGIFISSALIQIICTLLSERIETLCTKRDIIDKIQIGFKKKYRTSEHLLTLKTAIKKYVTIGMKKTYASSIDFKKAYDSVWHEGLFHKLYKIGIPGKPNQLIKDIYKKTKRAVKVKDSSTDFFNYTKGVRQVPSVLFFLSSMWMIFFN